jgi:hypothetical protein
MEKACLRHGAQDLAIACIHICRAIDRGERVGFFWDPATAGPRPDAWCRACETWNLAHPDAPFEEWRQVADFQLLCVQCWDEAQQVCGGA